MIKKFQCQLADPAGKHLRQDVDNVSAETRKLKEVLLCW